MPSPHGAQTVSKVDLGQKLAKRKSQEFAAKVARWNSSGGGIAQEQDQDKIVVVTEESSDRIDTTPAIIEVVPDDTDSSEENNEQQEAKNVEPGAINTKARIPALVPTQNNADKTANPKRTSRAVDIERKAWVRRKSRPQAEFEVEADVKHASTPKKRVISDGHWRRDRRAKSVTPEKEVTTPKPIVVRHSVASVGLKVPPTVFSFVEELESRPSRVRPSTRQRSRSRSKSRERSATREGTPDYESSGLKVYVKRRKPSQRLGDELKPKSARSSDSGLTVFSESRNLSSTDITTPAASPLKTTPARPSTAPKERRSRNSPEALASTPHSAPRHPREEDAALRRASNRKSSVNVRQERKSSTPEAGLVPAPLQPGAPRVFGTRIEGWLAGTSDPFTEPTISSASPPPNRQKSRRHPEDKENEITHDFDDQTRQQTSLSRRFEPNRDRTENDKAQRILSLIRTSPRGEEEATSPRTPTLRRRGARRNTTSPVKDRGSRDATPTEEVTQDSRRDYPKTSRPLPSVPAPPRRALTNVHELSTIASVETFNSHNESADQPRLLLDGSVLSRASDGDERNPPGSLKRRLTTHSYLISALSVSRTESKGGRVRRSVRSQHTKDNMTLGDIMNEITTDELKYQRELRTLVDGVIPVLLQSVLSDSKNVAASKLFGHAMNNGQAATKPIIDMGVALERLKTTHKRIPMHSANELLDWAKGASKIYTEYLQVWRLGFNDVVVNLAPAEAAEKQSTQRWDDGLPRNEKGDLLSGNGERVDVAYLLKRPLVRLKHFAKTFASINQLAPSQHAETMTNDFQKLVHEARRRANEERARLEDEAAAAIDPTRARDCRSLAPISGVQIDHTRCVRARDYFDLDLRHSTGQQLCCKIEIIMRDDAPDRGDAGDVLFCEITPTGRWLLFPPVHATMISARKGNKEGELIIMTRGYLQSSGREWREVLLLQAECDEAVTEWLGMLPSKPVPSNLATKSSFDLRQNPIMSGALPEPASPEVTPMPSLREVEIPIGERVVSSSNVWDASEVNSNAGDDAPVTGLRRMRATRRKSQHSPGVDYAMQAMNQRYPAGDPEAYRERPRANDMQPSPSTRQTRSSWHVGTKTPHSKAEYSVWVPPSRRASDETSADEQDAPPPKRPGMQKRTSSVPSMDLPTIHKLRKPSQPKTPERNINRHQAEESTPAVPVHHPEPVSAPAKMQRHDPTPPKERHKEAHPSSPSQVRPTSLGLRSSVIPSFTPAFLRRHRRSSSPLKHEYAPSNSSSSSDSEVPDLDEESFTSNSSADELPEDQISTVGELKSFPTFGGYKPMVQRTPPGSVFSPSDPSLAPSQSASQAPYRTVPPPQVKVVETVACIFVWSDKGSWDNLHPEECCIVVTPGLIEAFDIAQAHAAPAKDGQQAQQSPSTRGVKPLVALELTPLVPLRRGTALDISIRSPPTANSLYHTGSNIMFRSRNAEECEGLYHMINRARIDNPTYIALQRARGPQATSNWGEVMDRQNAARSTSGSWWNLGSRKGSTYRSKSTSRPQSIAATESSVGTMNSAFSALRRFSGSNRFFNIAKSTITSRQGSRSTYSDSLDSGVASPITIDPSLGTPLGLTNMKIRLYIREVASKWRDLGSARLTILIPPRPDPSLPANPATTGRDKRIIISGKTQNETLLDATLGESCFERIARTGIAISVWEENVDGQVAAAGGVLAAKSKVYMIQMKSDREAAYAFGLVGKLRY